MKETDKNQNYTQDRERVKKAISAYKERLYLSVISNDKSQVKIGESFANVGWLKFGQIDAMVQFTDREVDEEKLLPSLEVFDTKTICKIAAICFCDTFWKIKIKYPVLWRWYYYFCHYGHKELSELITFVCQMKTFLPKELISDGDEVNLAQLDSKWLYEPKKFLFGLIRCNEYEFDWVQTFAQLSLLSLKKPVNITEA